MQTEVLTDMPIGVAGQLADLHTEEFGDVVTATSEEDPGPPAVEIPFGIAVKAGTSDDGVLLLTGSSDVPTGVTVFASLYNKPTQLGDVGLKPGVTFDKLRQGKILVTVEDGCALTDSVHIRHTTTTSEQVGGFKGTAEAGKTIRITSGAKWLTACDTGELAVLSIDFDTLAFSADT